MYSDPQRGERILDMCAAPGGKTTAIAILMKDEGEIIATDRSHNKVRILNSSKRLTITTCLLELKFTAVRGCHGRSITFFYQHIVLFYDLFQTFIGCQPSVPCFRYT